jgi:hypothetical protein
MGVPISIRLDDDVRTELDAQAASLGIGLATYLRELATKAARDAKRARIRAASSDVARYAANTPGGAAFYDDWGSPDSNIG